MKLARQMLPGRQEAAGRRSPAGRRAVTLPFYAGCAIPQDHELHAVVHEVAAGFGVRLDEAADAGCCGHPSRGAVGTPVHRRRHASTRRARPATRASTRAASRPSRSGTRSPNRRRPQLDDQRCRRPARASSPTSAASPTADAALAALGDAAEQAGADDGGRVPDAPQRLLRRPRRHVPRRHQSQRHAPGVRRRRGTRPSSPRACSAATTCARPRASSSTTSPSTSGPSSSGPCPARTSRPRPRSAPMTDAKDNPYAHIADDTFGPHRGATPTWSSGS